MKNLSYLLTLLLLLGTPLFLSTCKKDEPNKPTLAALTPATGHEGDVIVVSGTFLGSTKKIKFGSVDGVVIDPKGGEVTTQVPAGLALGKVDVTVQTDGGTSNAVSFTVLPPAPEVTSINPVKAGPGMTVAITGKFFCPLVIPVNRCPIRIESGSSLPCFSRSNGLSSNSSICEGPPD